jgi:hypothetical protein
MLLLAVVLCLISALFAAPLIGLFLLGRFLFPEGSTRDYEIEPSADKARGLTGATVWRVWQKWMKDKPQQITSREQG